MSGQLFDADSIKKAISDDLKTDLTIPNDHKGALIMFVNTNKVEVALATKINNHWSVDLLAQHEWTGDNEIGAISKITW